MPDYQKAKIYKLWCPSNDLVYIGSTTQPLYKRLNGHRTNAKKRRNERSYMLFDIGDEVKIELIEEYPCDNKMELIKKEGEWIRKTECVNRCVAGRTQKEYQEENKDNIKKYHQQYYETNKESIAVKAKEYREENKEKLNAQKREYYLKPENKLRKAETDKNYREAHKDEIKEKRKDYFDEYNNKEEVKDKKNEWYLANKEKSYTSCKERRQIKTECDICGVVYTACRKSEHIKTEKHLWSVENNQKYCNHVPFGTREVTCECGSVCFGKNLADHLKSRKHQNYINAQNQQ
jgi:hypothetical protein